MSSRTKAWICDMDFKTKQVSFGLSVVIIPYSTLINLKVGPEVKKLLNSTYILTTIPLILGS